MLSTITFCDQGENHIINKKIGKLAESEFTIGRTMNKCIRHQVI